MTDRTDHIAQADTTMSRGLAITAIVLSVVAIGFSGWVFFQLPEEVSLTDLEQQVASNTTAIEVAASDASDNSQTIRDLTGEVQEAFDALWPRLTGVERDASDAQDSADDAMTLADEAYNRAEGIEQDLGICLYVQEIGVRYTYWSNVTFGGQEYMYRCER